jgi:hypothetical protein
MLVATPEPIVVSTPYPPEPTAAESPEPLQDGGNPSVDDSKDDDAKDGGPADSNGAGEASSGPRFSACEGLTGLQNAICRHEVLLQLHPNSRGLQNALAHLRENLGRHQANGSGKGAHGNPNGDGAD